MNQDKDVIACELEKDLGKVVPDIYFESGTGIGQKIDSLPDFFQVFILLQLASDIEQVATGYLNEQGYLLAESESQEDETVRLR